MRTTHLVASTISHRKVMSTTGENRAHQAKCSAHLEFPPLKTQNLHSTVIKYQIEEREIAS